MENGEGKNIKMAHADVVGDGGDVKGKTYGHAFILLGDDKVLDVCQNTTMDKRKYYDMGQVSNVKEYTLQEAVQKAVVETGHFGPWH
jgi:hypothetical protein